MRNLEINKGYKEYTINGDEAKVIRVKTTDFSLIDNLRNFEKKVITVAEELDELKNTDDADVILEKIKAADKKVKAELDMIFDDNVSEVVFGSMNCLSYTDGQPVAYGFIEAIIPEIEKDLKAEGKAAQKRIEKYSNAAKQFK